MQLDTENRYDARAVMITYKDYKLGYLPREHNRIIYELLKVGVSNISLRIQRLDHSEHPESQVGVVVHLINKN